MPNPNLAVLNNEYGQGYVDEHRVEPMDLVVDKELFAIETISSRTQFLMNKPPERYPVSDDRNNDVDMELFNKRRYKVYSDDEKTRFFTYFLANAQVLLLPRDKPGVHIRATQRWVKRYCEDTESIFEKKKKLGRRRILGEEHKQLILRCIDENPSAVLTEMVGNLMQNFVDFNVSRSTVINS